MIFQFISISLKHEGRIMKKSLVILIAFIVLTGTALTVSGSGSAAPDKYGSIVMNNFSKKAGLAPVVFDHWLHRAKHTCRLCHVDIMFSMKAGDTGVTAQDNMDDLFCGACHNGKMKHEGKTIFDSCSTDRSDMKPCERCHSQGKNVKRQYDFAKFTAKLPKAKFGNGVNWEKAAADGIIKPIDQVEGISMKRPARKMVKGVNDIIFSHKKHARWNGCEVCHPEIFAGGKRGKMVYTMDDIKNQKFCGVCHTTVAFPLKQCDRCHTKAGN
jgi:c(7)-type cytochrome triheme protein